MSTNYAVSVAPAPLMTLDALEFIKDPRHGGQAIFQGVVRDHHLGRSVLGITYDVHEALALNIFTDIYHTAIKHLGKELRLFISHAKGRLNVGDVSVIVAVSTPHRDEAFQACRFAIETIKHQSPIWKQEHYTDGNSEWVKGHSLCQHSAMNPEDFFVHET